MAATMLTRDDIQALKDYVSAPGNLGQNQADSTVRLHVTHSNLKAEFMELRLDLHVSWPYVH
jgi:tubulin-folding cofactor B